MPTIIHEPTLTMSTPTLMQTESVDVEAGNIIHRIAGSSEPYVTLRDDSLRIGRHQAFYAAEADAMQAVEMLRLPGAFQIDYPERPSFEMRFVTTGRITLRLDATTKDHWYVEFGFQEIAP